MQTRVSGLNALFWCTKVAELVSLQMHPFYSIGPKFMFGYLLDHLKNLRHVKRWKTCVSGLNALIWSSEVAKIFWHQKHPFYSIGPQMVFCCLLEHLENLQHVKKMQNLRSVYRSCKNGFTPNASIVLHWTPNDVWLSFGAFRKPSVCKKMQNLCFGPKCTIWCTVVVEMVSH
jgi:hypothetical protein